jgi:YidC/Oxa1 family membrane protein insertase
VHQILLEQHKFMSSKGIKMGRQAVVMLANAGVFLTNFFAIKKMVEVSYPGFENGGILWFPNLLEPDAYMGLPAISALTTFVIFRMGIDSGVSNDQMTPTMKICMQWAFPAIILVSGYWFSSVRFLMPYLPVYREIF